MAHRQADVSTSGKSRTGTRSLKSPGRKINLSEPGGTEAVMAFN
jgi:hypothetical protein